MNSEKFLDASRKIYYNIYVNKKGELKTKAKVRDLSLSFLNERNTYDWKRTTRFRFD